MSGAAQRTRVRKTRRYSRLACGHWASAGALIVSHNRGPWMCTECSHAPIHNAGQAPRRGAWTIAEALQDEARRL